MLHLLLQDWYDLKLHSDKIWLCHTLTPTRMPLSLIILTKGTPLSECWYSVSWKKMTPPMQELMRSSALKRICRYCLRFSSVFSTPTWASLLAMLPAVHTQDVLFGLVFISDREKACFHHAHKSLLYMFPQTERMKEGQSVFYRPTDSSAARMPFPLETMRRAVSCSSLFCASVSEGNWCVILSNSCPTASDRGCKFVIG